MSVDERRRIFSKWLAKEMNERGWSQSDLAQASNLHRAVINKLLQNKYLPHTDSLIAISHGLSVPVEASFRAAGLLPPVSDEDEFLEEAVYLLRTIQNAERRETAVALLKVLATKEQ